MTYVWVLCMGERSEGADPIAVFASRPTFDACAAMSTPCFGPWVSSGDDADGFVAESGCDVLRLVRFEVLP